jgi:hypothetical protein
VGSLLERRREVDKELERSFPYGIARQLFERLAPGRRPSDRSQLLTGAAGLAAPVFGLASLGATTSALRASPAARGSRR